MADLNELERSRQIIHRVDRIEATRMFEGLWKDRNTVRPEMYSDYPDKKDTGGIRLRCAEVVTDRIPSVDGDRFRMTARYVTLDPNTSLIENSEEYTYGGEVLEVGRGRTWVSDGSTIQHGVTLKLPHIEWKVRRTLQSFHGSTVFALLGLLNSAPFGGFSRGTLLFEGAHATRRGGGLLPLQPGQPGLGGLTGHWQVEYSFLGRRTDHNVIWNEESGRWDKTSPLLYKYGNFGGLP